MARWNDFWVKQGSMSEETRELGFTLSMMKMHCIPSAQALYLSQKLSNTPLGFWVVVVRWVRDSKICVWTSSVPTSWMQWSSSKTILILIACAHLLRYQHTNHGREFKRQQQPKQNLSTWQQPWQLWHQLTADKHIESFPLLNTASKEWTYCNVTTGSSLFNY